MGHFSRLFGRQQEFSLNTSGSHFKTILEPLFPPSCHTLRSKLSILNIASY